MCCTLRRRGGETHSGFKLTRKKDGTLEASGKKAQKPLQTGPLEALQHSKRRRGGVSGGTLFLGAFLWKQRQQGVCSGELFFSLWTLCPALLFSQR